VELVVPEAAQEISPGALRVILVPFQVPPGGNIEVASISDGTTAKVPPGRYSLRYEASLRGKQPRIRLVLMPPASVDFAVQVADSELSPPKKLLLTAKPAS
jgi:hypothetical protein